MSISTAERMLKEAEAADHIVVYDRDDGEVSGKALHLFAALKDHCIRYCSKRTIRIVETFASDVEVLVVDEDAPLA